MNERIWELAEQAWETIDVSAKLGIPGTERVFNKEKFAELIIKECANVAVFKDAGLIATADVAGYMAAGRAMSARMIKEHFGVE